jgi:hypothetical protein
MELLGWFCNDCVGGFLNLQKMVVCFYLAEIATGRNIGLLFE